MIRWEEIDTVLLDMDGTLLDLAYDNTLWAQILPRRYSETYQLSLEAAEQRLFKHMSECRGKLVFYCLDYWAQYTGLDVVSLHHELTELIAYRPYAEDFLDHLLALQRRSVLVTNAHRGSLDVKDRHANLAGKLDAVVSCHDYGAPKESRQFWDSLMDQHPFDPGRTLLIDDNASVLDAAGEFGIAHLLTIAQPDSQRPPRDGLKHRAVEDFRDLIHPPHRAEERSA